MGFSCVNNNVVIPAGVSLRFAPAIRLRRANPTGSPPSRNTRKTNKALWAFFIFLVTPAGVEPAIFWMRTRRPRPLDEGANSVILTQISLVFNPAVIRHRFYKSLARR